MGCMSSKTADPVEKDAAQRNQRIDKVLKGDKKTMDRTIKILLLGAGESGKSTIIKQMRIIHSGGFPNDERCQTRAVIYSNLIIAFKVLLDIMNAEHIEFEHDTTKPLAQHVDHADPDVGSEEAFSDLTIRDAMRNMWKDAGVQKAVARGHEFALHDNLHYYFDSLDRLFTPGWLPDNQDMLQARLRSTGITETLFELGQMNFRMMDVGGQRSERKKWIHCFEGVQCLLFMVALSGYDQCLVEDQSAPRFWVDQLLKRMTTMLSSSLRRAAWTPIVPISGIARATGAGSGNGASNNNNNNYNGGGPQQQQRQVRQRRYSSSSSKPSDGSRGLDASSSSGQAPANNNGSGENGNKREGKSRRRGKAAQQQQQHDAVFSKLPSVPSTQYQQPHDVHVASFFSIHRPISVSNTVPPNSSQEAFDAIFSSKKSPKAEQEDVLYTLSSAAQSMEHSAQYFSEQDGQQLAVDVQPYDAMNMTDIKHSVEEFTKHLRPFHPPPPPVPFDQAKNIVGNNKNSNTKQSEVSPSPSPSKETSIYSTVLTIHESTDAIGRKTYEAHTTPFVRAKDMDAPGATQNESFSDEAPRNSGKTYIERTRKNRTMHAISTRRRRQAKMKKHKLKKLLRRTRTLRRKLDKA